MPTRAQTSRNKATFLLAFRVLGNVTTAATNSGVTRGAVYRWRERDKRFAAAYAEAEIEATEHLEAEARRRAVEGVARNRPIYYQGSRVGVERITEYSDTLLIFLLKARAPERYRERHELLGDASAPLRIVIDDARDPPG